MAAPPRCRWYVQVDRGSPKFSDRDEAKFYFGGTTPDMPLNMMSNVAIAGWPIERRLHDETTY